MRVFGYCVGNACLRACGWGGGGGGVLASGAVDRRSDHSYVLSLLPGHAEELFCAGISRANASEGSEPYRLANTTAARLNICDGHLVQLYVSIQNQEQDREKHAHSPLHGDAARPLGRFFLRPLCCHCDCIIPGRALRRFGSLLQSPFLNVNGGAALSQQLKHFGSSKAHTPPPLAHPEPNNASVFVWWVEHSHKELAVSLAALKVRPRPCTNPRQSEPQSAAARLAQAGREWIFA